MMDKEQVDVTSPQKSFDGRQAWRGREWAQAGIWDSLTWAMTWVNTISEEENANDKEQRADDPIR